MKGYILIFLGFLSLSYSANAQMFGGQIQASKLGTVNTLQCSTALHNGALFAQFSSAGASSVIAYTGGNGGAYAGQTINSTGIPGLTASISGGNFANGNGSLTFFISGTPSDAGIASFYLNIGGQSCTFSRVVYPSYRAGNIFCNGSPTVVNDVTNPLTGKTWMDRNLGATQVATASLDSNAFGDLYQWGRPPDGHQCRNSVNTYTLSPTYQPLNGNFIISPLFDPINPYPGWWSIQNPSSHLWDHVYSPNNPCPSGYRLPYASEFYEEIGTWSSFNAQGAISSILKLPLSGARNGSINNPYLGTSASGSGYYWTISGLDFITQEGGVVAQRLYFDQNYAFTGQISFGAADGIGVRCIKESLPQASITTLDCNNISNYGPLQAGIATSFVYSNIPYTGGNGGIYQEQTINSTGVLGLVATLSYGTLNTGAGSLSVFITGTPNQAGIASFVLSIGGQSCIINRNVSSIYPQGSVFCNGTQTVLVNVTNPVTGKTWMDRNLGALQAADSSTDANAFGDLYQWGRSGDGHQCRNSATLSIQSSVEQPNHSSFIIGFTDWLNPPNANLWQGLSGINNPCPNGYRLPTTPELYDEQTSWTSNGSSGAFASPLKLPMAGYRNRLDGIINDEGSFGCIWSSTVNGTRGGSLGFYNGSANVSNFDYRSHGFSIRCIRD